MEKNSGQDKPIDSASSLKRWLNDKTKEISKELPQARVVAQTRGWEVFLPEFTTHYLAEVRVIIVDSRDNSERIHRALENLGNEFAELGIPGFRVSELAGPHHPIGENNEDQSNRHLYILSLSTGSQHPTPVIKEDEAFLNKKVLPWTKDF